MNFPFYIARRYLVSKKSTNVINIISAVSALGVTVGTAALIAVLSVFNGLDGLIKSLFSSFDPDIRITLAEGKTFSTDSTVFEQIRKMKGVACYSDILEENALFRFGNKEFVATIKGVDSNYVRMTGIDTMMVDGQFILNSYGKSFAVAGYGVAAALSLSLNLIEPLSVYLPRRGKVSSLNVENAINSSVITPAGIFSIQQEIDNKYVIVPIEFARNLLNYNDEVTSMEIKLDGNFDHDKLQDRIKKILGSGFVVKNRYQQQELIYKTVQSEKLIGFIILAFILFIASFNIIGSLTMLIIDKKKDIETLRSLGAEMQTIRTIFLFEGWMISLTGALAGLLLGGLSCLVQDKIGIVPLAGEGTFIVKYYPVNMLLSDFVSVFLTATAIGFIAAWYPVRYITKKYIQDK